MPLKYINGHQVNLKNTVKYQEKHFMKISLLKQIKIGILSLYTCNSNLKIVLNICLRLLYPPYSKIVKYIKINIKTKHNILSLIA